MNPLSFNSIVLCLTISSCISGKNTEEIRSQKYDEPYRPQFHFSPEVNWINDPNGLVFFDGEYHLFYQYNPEGIQWGHMSWGHAVSEDLTHWSHLPVAIPEHDHTMIFSGSAVVDSENTSGLCETNHQKGCLIAIYTAHETKPGTDEVRQTQSIAYSNDRGRTWKRYEHNPVLDLNLRDFRDPKVFWYEPDRKWIMIVALPANHKVQFYGSPDLKRWTFLSEFGPAGATGGVWECPDLFPLPVEGNSSELRWVLEVDLNPGAIAGGSGGQYFIGQFDGTSFQADYLEDGVYPLWVDYGKDFYAAVSWNNLPDNRRVWIAWMNNWQYANDIPTNPWRGSMTIPRQLKLRETEEGIRLIQEPVSELTSLRRAPFEIQGTSIDSVNAEIRRKNIYGATLEITTTIEPGDAVLSGIHVREGNGHMTRVGYDASRKEIFVDRSHAGISRFHPEFAGRHAAPIAIENGSIRLHIFVDRSSVEVFAGGGRYVITDRIFPDLSSTAVSFFAEDGDIKSITARIWPLKGIWAHSNP